MTALVVIPARWGSTRFPGKPLAIVGGRTLLERAIDLGRRAVRGVSDTELVVATDDERIAKHAEATGCAAVMTDPAIATGSGRALAAAMARAAQPSVVLNLQGDAPFLAADTVRILLDTLASGDAGCATPVAPLDWDDLDDLRAHKQAAPASGTTCIRGPDGRALWFSKQILPMMRDEAARRAAGWPCPVLRHLGLYAYRLPALQRFEASSPTALETWEGLEQLRLIELGIAIEAVQVAPPPIPAGGIDTPLDVTRAERLIARFGDPFGT